VGIAHSWPGEAPALVQMKQGLLAKVGLGGLGEEAGLGSTSGIQRRLGVGNTVIVHTHSEAQQLLELLLARLARWKPEAGHGMRLKLSGRVL